LGLGGASGRGEICSASWYRSVIGRQSNQLKKTMDRKKILSSEETAGGERWKKGAWLDIPGEEKVHGPPEPTHEGGGRFSEIGEIV